VDEAGKGSVGGIRSSAIIVAASIFDNERRKIKQAAENSLSHWERDGVEGLAMKKKKGFFGFFFSKPSP